jgi:hypothetical protein
MKTSFITFSQKFNQQFGEYIESLIKNSRWSDGQPVTGIGIRVDDFKTVKNSAEFDQPGIYIWGNDQRVIYVGITEKQSLRNRLGGRYIGKGNKSQVSLAKKIQNNELEIQDLLADNTVSKVRALGADAFAERTTDELWVFHYPIRRRRERVYSCIRKHLNSGCYQVE